MSDNTIYTSVSTDQAISDILNNFSDDFIENIIEESLKYKFRPYNTRMPNHPYVFEQQFKGIYDNYEGDRKDLIDEKRHDTYMKILDIICEHYDLKITTDIPEENLYSLAYTIYQIFVTEFTTRMVNLFANYIIINKESILNGLTEEQRTGKSTYAKKLYSDSKDQSIIALYDNMESVFNIVTAVDIPFYNLLVLLSDEASANFIVSFISDCGDLYKNHYSAYLMDFTSRTDMLSSIKLQLVSFTAQNASILHPETNPCIIDK